MATIYDVRSVDPATVTNADIDAVFASHGIDRAANGIPDFLQPGTTYRRYDDTFRCVAVGRYRSDGLPVALGFMPVNLGGEPGWEIMLVASREWAAKWTAVPEEYGPMTPVGGA